MSQLSQNVFVFHVDLVFCELFQFTHGTLLLEHPVYYYIVIWNMSNVCSLLCLFGCFIAASLIELYSWDTN